MAGIGAVRHPVTDVSPDHLPERCQLLEVAAERGAAAGGGLQQYHHRARHGAQAAGVSGGIPSEAGFPVIHVVAGVRHQVVECRTPRIAGAPP